MELEDKTPCCAPAAECAGGIAGVGGLPQGSLDSRITEIKSLRRDLDTMIQRARRLEWNIANEEQQEARKHLQSAVMWLGMALKAINDANPGTSPEPLPEQQGSIEYPD